ncbi:MAG: DUF2804 domain-containing protein [Alcanivoracaceae bacterium]|jgi:hypothetical protein|nr:DUF2804 domain-containing protein [Alcanivoracaceae bacterium]
MKHDDTATPDQLIDAAGAPHWGIFPGSVACINGLQADYRNALGAVVPGWRKRFNYKQFQYFGVISDQVLIGCALADTAWLGLAFVYVFDARSQKLQEYTWRSPLSRAMQLSDSPCEGESRFQQHGIDIRLGYRRDNGTLIKTLQIDSKVLSVNAQMVESSPFSPMSLCTRAGINGWVYANKVAGLPVSGELRLEQETLDLGAIGACGHHDFSAGFMRRETFWNWACFSGLQQGKLVGINLSCGVNETSYTENCLWLNGELIKVDTVRFDYNRDDLMQPWKVVSLDGQVELTFVPQGNHKEKMNLGLFASNFNQLFGQFQGVLRPAGRDPIEIKQLNGFVEEQYAKW